MDSLGTSRDRLRTLVVATVAVVGGLGVAGLLYALSWLCSVVSVEISSSALYLIGALWSIGLALLATLIYQWRSIRPDLSTLERIARSTLGVGIYFGIIAAMSIMIGLALSLVWIALTVLHIPTALQICAWAWFIWTIGSGILISIWYVRIALLPMDWTAELDVN